MKKLVLILMVAFVGLAGWSQDSSSKTAFYNADGSFWNQLDADTKSLLAGGFETGLFASTSVLNTLDANTKSLLATGFQKVVIRMLANVSPNMLAAAVDSYYSDETNTKDTLAFAFMKSLALMKQQ